MIIIVGGQTGVDRGAHKAAWDKGLKVEGFMPMTGVDEDGPIPPGIAKDLKPCPIEGYAARTVMNLEEAHGVLIIIETLGRLFATPGTKMTWQHASVMGLPRWYVDPHSSIKELAHNIQRASIERLMVAGPRHSLWPEGEDEARRIVRALATFW